MLYSKNQEEMLKIAEEIGIRLKFNSTNPGITNIETGQTEDLWTIFEKTGLNMGYIFDDTDVERMNPRINSEYTKGFQIFEQNFWDCA